MTCVNEIINDDYRGNLIYILNPTIGDLANNNQLIIQQASRLVEEQPSIIFGIIVTNGTDITEIEYWRNIFPNSRFVLIHKGELNINYANAINGMPHIIENIFYSNRVSSLYVNQFIQNKVILEDCFNRLRLCSNNPLISSLNFDKIPYSKLNYKGFYHVRRNKRIRHFKTTF